MKKLKKLLVYSAIAMSSIAIYNLSPSAIVPNHPLLSRLNASGIACPDDPNNIELLTEDASNTLVWMVKGSEGDPDTGKGGVGLEHIIYHNNYNKRRGTYTSPSTHLLDIAKKLCILKDIDKDIKFNFLKEGSDKKVEINLEEVDKYKRDFVPKYKEDVLRHVEQIIKTGTKMSPSKILKHGEYDLDIESKKSDEGWVYTDGKIMIFVRSNGFISNIFPTSGVKKGFITVVTDGDQDFQQRHSAAAHQQIVSLKNEYQEYLDRYKESEAHFPVLTLKQFFEYKSKYADEMDVMFYNKVVSLKEFENPDDFFTAIELGFKSASDYYIWLGKISHTRIKIPATYHKILLPNLNNDYKYRMFKIFTGRTTLTYNEYRDIINNLED